MPPETQGGGTSSGICFGYAVTSSSLLFRYLREGPGTPLSIERADIVPRPTGVPLAEWGPSPARPFCRVYANDEKFQVWLDRVGWFDIDPVAPSIAVAPSHEDARWEALLWGIPAALCMIGRGDLPVHASAVDVGGSGLILGAPGRFGKTTLAAAFLAAGHRVLAEDVACCRPSPDPALLPGPAMLRVRPDAYERLRLPGTHVVAEDPDRVYLGIDESLRGDGSPVPLRGIVFLREGDGPVRVEPASGLSSLPDLWYLSFNLPIDSDRARSFQGISAVANAVPVWNLYRELDFDELPRVVDAIVSTCLST